MNESSNKTVKALRSTLKHFISDELESLPETLEELEPKDRLNFLIKLLPYAMPKTEKVKSTYGEPTDWSL